MMGKNYEQTLSGKKCKTKGMNAQTKEEMELVGKFICFGTEVAAPAGTAAFTVAIIRQDKTGEIFTAPPSAVTFLE